MVVIDSTVPGRVLH